jgi:DNA-binding YbaB/EbfC family protein
MKLDIQSLMQQVQNMQEEMEKKKQELNSKIVTAESGGGMVSVTMTCNYRITNLKISKELTNTNDAEMLEDLVIAAVNKALSSASQLVEEEMGKMSGMLPNIPGLNL